MKNWPLCASCCERVYNPAVTKGGCSWCKSKSMKGWVMFGTNTAPGIPRPKKWVVSEMRQVVYWGKESRELEMPGGQRVRLADGIYPYIMKGQLLSLRFYLSKKIYSIGYKGDLKECLDQALKKKQEMLRCTR